jgi:hypothetical protein
MLVIQYHQVTLDVILYEQQSPKTLKGTCMRNRLFQSKNTWRLFAVLLIATSLSSCKSIPETGNDSESGLVSASERKSYVNLLCELAGKRTIDFVILSNAKFEGRTLPDLGKLNVWADPEVHGFYVTKCQSRGECRQITLSFSMRGKDDDQTETYYYTVDDSAGMDRLPSFKFYTTPSCSRSFGKLVLTSPDGPDFNPRGSIQTEMYYGPQMWMNIRHNSERLNRFAYRNPSAGI